MPKKSNLIQRGGRWYFNRAIPKDLWPSLGKAPFRVALQTDSLDVAIRRRPDAERQYFAKIDEARAALKKNQPRQLSDVEAVSLAARWFRQELAERTSDLEAARGPFFDMNAHLAELVDYEADARQAIAEGELYVVRPTAERLLEEEGFAIDHKSPAFKALQRVILRGRRELALLEKARTLGDYAAKPGDELFASAMQESVERPQRTIADLIGAHKADKVAARSQSTQAACEPVWRFLNDVLGPNRPLARLDERRGAYCSKLPRLCREVSGRTGPSGGYQCRRRWKKGADWVFQ